MKTNFNFETADASVTLGELRPGERATVLGVDREGPIGRRLLDMGFLPGTPVVLLRRAPLGDPAVYELRGYQLCLRRSEALCISVRRMDDAAPAENPRP